jgi:hypothetical protein
MLLTESQEKRVRRQPDMRPLLKGMYPVALAIMLIPIFEMSVGIGVWPPRLWDLNWRFGSIGMLLKSLVVPLFGLGIASTIAAFLEQRRVLRMFACIGIALSALIVVAVGIFALDYLQLRNVVPVQIKSAMDKTAFTAVTIGILLVPVAMGIGIGGWKSSRLKASERGDAVRSKKDVGLMVHTPPNPKESAS